jgi:hypothetical protein
LSLLAQISIAQKRPEKVGEYVRKIGITPDNLPTPTAFQIAEALRESAIPVDQSLAKLWLTVVSKRRLEVDEVKRVAMAMRKLGKDEDAVQLITRFISAHSSPVLIPAVLYDLRARAKIDLSKKCMTTGREATTPASLRARAWEQCRQYLDEAEGDIIKALAGEPNDREQEYYQKDLEFVRQLQAQARKPHEPRRRHGQSDHRGGSARPRSTRLPPGFDAGFDPERWGAK